MQNMRAEPDDYRLTSTGCGFSLIKKSHAITNPTRHFHPWWEILYIESGERTFFYANRRGRSSASPRESSIAR